MFQSLFQNMHNKWNLAQGTGACGWNCEVYDLESGSTPLSRDTRLPAGSDKVGEAPTLQGLVEPGKASCKASFDLNSPFTLHILRSTRCIATTVQLR